MSRSFSFFAGLMTVAVILMPASIAVAQESDAQPTQNEIPFRADAGLTKIETLLSHGRYSQAMNEIGNVLKRNPNSADAYTYQGYSWFKLGEMDKARRSFETALKIDSRHLGANKYMADLYLAEGDLPRAVEQMQVLRMVCGVTDCAELTALEIAIDKYKRGEKPE